MHCMSMPTAAIVTIQQYADAQRVSFKTVNNWLRLGKLAGAYKNERGQWMIPLDARPVATAVVDRVDSPTPAATLDTLPSFLTLEQASALLGISRHAIASHRDYFDVVPFGAHGGLVIPLATIKRVRGL